ncbi:MAG: 4-hydroxy-tetrahydrodipicolinate synthase [bacterium]
MFKGTFTALVTPFKDGVVDTQAFHDLIERQLAAGIDGVLAVGTTGESPTLNHEEHLRVIELAIRRAKGKATVLAGTGSNSTDEAIELTQAAEEMGADAALLVAPYYNKPSQNGLYEHFMAIAQSVKIPLILYSIPGRCGVEIAVDTVARLARDAKNIVALKEAGGSVDRVSQLRQALSDEFDILCGDDSLTVPFISVGAVGVISVASNVIPTEVKSMTETALKNNFKTAEREHRRLYPLFRDLFVEPNPVPIKAAMAELGWMQADCRLPLSKISDANKAKLLGTMRKMGLLQ